MDQIARFDLLCRSRELTDEESREVEKALRKEPRDPIYMRWTLDDRRELMSAAKVRGGLKEYSQRTGRPYSSCQTMLRDIKRQRRRRGVAFVGRFFYDGEEGCDD